MICVGVVATVVAVAFGVLALTTAVAPVVSMLYLVFAVTALGLNELLEMIRRPGRQDRRR